MRHGFKGGGSVLVAAQAGKLSIVRRIDALLDDVACAGALIARFSQRETAAVAARLGLLKCLAARCHGVVADGEHAFLGRALHIQLETVAPGLHAVGLDLEHQAGAVRQLVGLIAWPG